MGCIVVTGAARGIGQAIALRLMRDGQKPGAPPAQFVLADRLAEVKGIADAINAGGCAAVSVHGDLAEPQFCAEVIATAERTYGGLDLLVCNAGIQVPGPLNALPLESWDRVLDVNVRATWLLAKAAYPMLKRSHGQIVVIASVSALNPQPWVGAYSVSKAAVKMLGEQLAIEWGREGIRTNMVSPGTVRTPLVEAAYADPAVRAKREQLNPLGRIGSAEEIAGAVSFLAGPDASYCNGANIVVDGGLTRGLMLQLARPTQT